MLLWATGTCRGFYLTSQTQNVGIVSPIKFAQLLVLLILLLPVIVPVPQNKIIYTGGSSWHFERNDNSCARMTYALKCHQNPPPTRTTKKNPLYVPTSSGKRVYCLWLRTTDTSWFFWHYFDCWGISSFSIPSCILVPWICWTNDHRIMCNNS